MKEKQRDLIPKYTKDVEVNGKKYKLIHPGMRLHTRWRRQCSEIVEGKIFFDLEKFLEFAFEGCIEPIDHTFLPNLDNVLDPKEQEEWARLLPRFLRGDSIDDFQGKEKKKGSQETS